MLQFCLKINPLDYLFSPAAELFISLAANIRISTQNFSMYAQKKIQYNLLITSTVREPLVLCMVQTAVLVQWGFVYNKITSWSKDTLTDSLLMLQVCQWSLGGRLFLLLVTGSNAEAPSDQAGWVSAWVLQHKDMVQCSFLLSGCRGAEEDASVGCCMHTHVCFKFNKALSGVFLLILWIFPHSSQVERSMSMQQVTAVSQTLTCH